MSCWTLSFGNLSPTVTGLILYTISPICHAFISSTFLKHWRDGAEILLEISQYLSYPLHQNTEVISVLHY